MNTEFFTKPAKKAGSRIAINLGSSRRNPHVAVPALLGIICEFGEIWLPAYSHQFHLTSKSLYAYAMLAAANANPSEHDEAPKPHHKKHKHH